MGQGVGSGGVWDRYLGVGFGTDGEPAVTGSGLTLYLAWRWWLDFLLEGKKSLELNCVMDCIDGSALELDCVMDCIALH